MRTALSILFMVLLWPAASPGSSINTSNRYAYGANIGWIDARADGTNGAVIGQFFCSGYLYGANVGWISLGKYPTSGTDWTDSGLGLLAPPANFDPTLTGEVTDPSFTTRFFQAKAVVPLAA